uniref:Uncharacterized protein n=1 Tax=Glossina pallidipes TaxID=7398 RepID=A0A1A9ZJC8_GLOPL
MKIKIVYKKLKHRLNRKSNRNLEEPFQDIKSDNIYVKLRNKLAFNSALCCPLHKTLQVPGLDMQCWILLCLSCTHMFTFTTSKSALTAAAHKDLCPITTQHFLSPKSKEENRTKNVSTSLAQNHASVCQRYKLRNFEIFHCRH